MGHGALVTTGRYLHARPVSEQEQVFTAAAFDLSADRELVASIPG